MRVALIGDVHTNVSALEAVIQDAHAHEVPVDDVWGLGDWLGYSLDSLPWVTWYRLQDRLFDDLRSNPGMHGVIGNHDIAVCEGIPGDRSYNDTAREAIYSQRQMLEGVHVWMDEFRPWLRAQPYLLSPGKGVYLAHGTFWMTHFNAIPFAYPRDVPHEDSFQSLHQWIANGPDSAVEPRAKAVDGWRPPLVLITGHTHIQGLWQRQPSDPSEREWRSVPAPMFDHEAVSSAAAAFQPVWEDFAIKVTPEQPLWVNPGSVGQRRDLRTPVPVGGDWARYAILEWNPEGGEAMVSLRWIPYVKEGRGRT